MSGRSPRLTLVLSVVAVLLTLGLPGTAYAQYRFDVWTTEQGLPQNTITSILQTRDGFLWLTTFGGLVRFDGAKLHVFSTVNAPGMRTSRLVGMLEGPDGALWVRTEAHGIIRYHQGGFTTYTQADGLPRNVVNRIVIEDGRLVAETLGGMARWDGTRFVSYTRPAGGPKAGWPLIGVSSAGATWYRGDGLLHRYEQGRPARTLAGFDPRRLFEDRAGGLWMETQDRRLQCLTPSGLKTYTAADGVPGVVTAIMSEDRDGHLWIGQRDGLLRFDGRRFTRYTVADGLPAGGMATVFQDREGTLWVLSESGLVRMTRRLITAYASSDGLEGDNTYPILQDRRGDILIGSWRGLTRYRDGVFTRLARDFGVADENVMSLAEDRDGALWIGTWGGGVRRVKDGTVTAFTGADGAPGQVVRAIYQGRTGDLWAGGADGLSRYRDGAFTRAAGYTGGEVHALLEDRAGTLWIGTEAGLVQWRAGVFTSIGEQAGLTGGPVRALYEDRDGTLWLGTYDSGLFRMRDGRLTRFTTREGLFANGAFQILEDAQERLWISSNSGIYRVARRDLNAFAEGRLAEVNSVPYGRRDGMLNPECNGGGQPAGIRARDGRIWFPTQQGVAVLDPESIPVDTTPPPVLITGVLVAGQPVAARDRVEIRGGPRAIEIHYAALTFIRPELTRFRYRIEGLDARWIDAGAAQTARFAQLPYGSFVFRVIAANRDGVWNTEGAAVQVVVVAPFWATRWFAALLAGGVAAMALGVHRARLAHVRRQEALRAAFSRQLIHSQESDRRRIAAGLHDGLSQSLIVIRNWALLGQQSLPDDPAVRERLGEIESTAAVALGEVREVVHDLAPYNLERLGLARVIEEMASRLGDSSGIRFTCRIADMDGKLPGPVEMNLYRVTQEALNNVVKHSGASRAWVEIEVDRGTLRVQVRDDGRGFDRAAPDPPGGQGGFGLFGMSERLRMIGGRLSIDSAAGRGTAITIEIPLEGAS